MEKKPYVAAILSAIYPGIGLIYAERYSLGVIVTVSTTILIAWQIIRFIGFINGIFVRPTSVFFLIYWVSVTVGSYKAVQLSKFELKEGKVGINDKESFVCPECLQENMECAEQCINCGKNLRQVLLYSNGSKGILHYPDVEINRIYIIDYHKNLRGKRNGKIDQYMIKDIKNLKIINQVQSAIQSHQQVSSALPFITLSFEYDNGNGHYKQKKVFIREEMIKDLREALRVRKVHFDEDMNF